MPTWKYHVVDVFTRQALEGNALAVFPDGSGIDDITMRRIARELNLSETVFILPPSSPQFAAKLRIFTPAREVPFAGHPTIGTSFVLLREGIVPKDRSRFVLEENIGPVPVRVEAGESPLIWLSTPPIHFGPTFDAALCAEVLDLNLSDLAGPAPELVNAGNPTIFIALKDKATVDRAWLDVSGMARLKQTYPEPGCVFVFCATATGAYSRMFAPDYGISEDPATGSATGPLAAYMIKHKLVSGDAGSRFISEQGAKMGRRSILHAQIIGDNGSEGIDVGGYVVPVAEGTMRLSYSTNPERSATAS